MGLDVTLCNPFVYCVLDLLDDLLIGVALASETTFRGLFFFLFSFSFFIFESCILSPFAQSVRPPLLRSCPLRGLLTYVSRMPFILTFKPMNMLAKHDGSNPWYPFPPGRVLPMDQNHSELFSNSHQILCPRYPKHRRCHCEPKFALMPPPIYLLHDILDFYLGPREHGLSICTLNVSVSEIDRLTGWITIVAEDKSS